MSVSENHGSVKTDETYVSPPQRDNAGDASGQPLLQRTVIIQKDLKGYGLAVGGEGPVHVTRVKPGGPAEKAGVQVGDKIIKVNGKLVQCSNHTEVVSLITAESYVAFTLLGKPVNTHTSHTELVMEHTPGLRDSSVFRSMSGLGRDSITGPQPVNAEKEKEVLLQKANTISAMYKQTLAECEVLKKKCNSSEKFIIQLQEKEKTLKALEAQLRALPAQNMTSRPSRDVQLPTINIETESLMSSGTSSLSSLTASAPYMSDKGSDATRTSLNTSPSPLHHQNLEPASDSSIESGSQNAMVLCQPQIIRMEDDDFPSEDENTGDQSVVFNNLNLMMIRPAHMAIFMNHVLHHHNPSSLLFYIIADIYSHAQGSVKDLKKWAYEIHSTFIIPMAPLKVPAVEEKIVQEIENNLARMDKEDHLRGIFASAQAVAKVDIEKLLENFREKKEKGLVYSSAEVKDDMEKSEELKLVEKCLMRHVENFASGEEDDKQMAQAWAIATFLRQNGVNKAGHLPNFVAKDKRGGSLFQFSSNKPKTKNHKGHQFNLHHLIKAEFCLHCSKPLWGIGYQGYQCQTCEQCVHRNCVEELKDPCDKDRKSRRISTLISFSKSRGGPATPIINDSEKEQIGNPLCLNQPSQPSVTPRPLKDAEDKKISNLTDEHSVVNLVNVFKTKSPEGDTPGRYARYRKQVVDFSPRKGTDLGRSESMKGQTNKHDKPAKRSNSDLLLDSKSSSELLDASQASSSNSSLSKDGSVQSLDTLMPQIQDDSDFEVEPELPTLKQVLGDEICKKLKPKEKKRQDVINELLYTEKNHVQALKILDILFYRPMLREPSIVQDFTKMLFPNLDTMIALHGSLNKSMKDRRKEKSVITEVGDILLERFDGEEGNNFRNGCAIFCRNQAFALETLKMKIRKEPKLAQLLSDAENNPLCRRLALKDIIPKQSMRLTKYPLLIASLLKYTQPNTKECTNLERALTCSRQILEYVNQAVKDCENQQRLTDLQRQIDKKAIDSESEELRAFDLTKHKLIHDGKLIWNINNRKQIELHVVLLERAMVLLQKLDDRLVLKLQNTQLVAGRTDTKKHSPLLWLSNILARNDATDKKAFFLMNTSQTGPQIYKLQAGSSEEQRTWLKFITQASEAVKKRENNSKNNLEEKPVLTPTSAWDSLQELEQVSYSEPDTTTTGPVITPDALPGLPIDPDIMTESVTLPEVLPNESDTLKDVENPMYTGDISGTDAETEGEITEEESPEELHENEPLDEDQTEDIEAQSGDVDTQNDKTFDDKNYDQGEDIDKVENDEVTDDGDGTYIVTEPNDSSFEANIGDSLTCNNLIDQCEIIPDSVAIERSTAIPEFNNVDNKLIEDLPSCIIDSAETTFETIEKKNIINEIPDEDAINDIEKKVDILVKPEASGNTDAFNNFLNEDIEVETIQKDNSDVKFNNNIENKVTENSDSINEIYDNTSVIVESPSTIPDIPTSNINACFNETMSSSEA